MDERFRTAAKTKDSMLLFSWNLIALFRAYKANTTLSFMNYMNPDMSSSSKKEEKAAKLLKDLYTCQDTS